MPPTGGLRMRAASLVRCTAGAALLTVLECEQPVLLKTRITTTNAPPCRHPPTHPAPTHPPPITRPRPSRSAFGGGSGPQSTSTRSPPGHHGHGAPRHPAAGTSSRPHCRRRAHQHDRRRRRMARRAASRATSARSGIVPRRVPKRHGWRVSTRAGSGPARSMRQLASACPTDRKETLRADTPDPPPTCGAGSATRCAA
jgi:hypothetical protein